MTSRELATASSQPEKRLRLHALSEQWAEKSFLLLVLPFSGFQILFAASRSAQNGGYAWLLSLPLAAVMVAITVFFARTGADGIFAHREGLEFRTGNDVRCFPWKMISKIEDIRGYNTVSSWSRAYRIVLVSGSTLTFTGRLDALARIESMRWNRDDPWHFEV